MKRSSKDSSRGMPVGIPSALVPLMNSASGPPFVSQKGNMAREVYHRAMPYYTTYSAPNMYMPEAQNISMQRDTNYFVTPCTLQRPLNSASKRIQGEQKV
jgi:hypothetical protein